MTRSGGGGWQQMGMWGVEGGAGVGDRRGGGVRVGLWG